MKKLYFLYLLLVSTTLLGQAPIITMISDGDCSGGQPKVVEIYASGTVDFSNYSLEKSANGGAFGGALSLAPLGVLTDEFAYVHYDDVAFGTEYPNATNTLATTAQAVNFNGDDAIRIVDGGSNVIDQYGEEVDGTGTAWEYMDGYAKRLDQETPNGGAFDPANWNINNGALNGLGTCQGGTDTYETIIGTGSFQPNTTPTLSASPSTLTGFTQFVGTPSAEQSFDVSGVNLTADVTLTVTTGDYEISETSGTGFGTSITLTQSGGSVGPTTIYVRLNGPAAQSPANGDITISSTGATDEIVTLEGEILNPAPTVFASPSSLSGFSHFVGTPSAEQTIDVSGEYLTDDITVTAPTNYEVSTTSGTGFGNSVTLTQSGGTVTSTTIYVRLNGPAANYSQTGDIVVSSTGANNETVALDGETLAYTLYPIGAVTTVDGQGVADSAGVYVELRGVVHCIDFDGNDGYSFTIIDGPGDGINVFNFNDVDGYVVTEGDSIGVKGQIDQFNGLIQVFAEEITLFSQGNAIVTPTVVTALDESTESQYVTLENLSLVNNEATWPANGNVDVTDGNNNYVIRIDADSPLAGTSTPNGPFDATGLGGQYDSSSPFDSGYQLFPCSVNPLCNVDVTTATTNATATANATGTGVTYQWIDCDNNNSPISGETDQSFTATTTGNYAVVITDGPCTDTSDCVNLEVCNVDVTTSTTDATITANATGLTYQWVDCDNTYEVIQGETGQSFTASANGNYAVIVTDGLCSDTSDCVTINSIGLEEEQMNISLYPNPVQEELSISSDGLTMSAVQVISVTGKVIFEQPITGTELKINTSSWNTGVYFVKVNVGTRSKIIKVIK